MTTAKRALVAGVPLLVVEPRADITRGLLALWEPFLSGSKERMEPMLQRLAGAGFHAVSFDPWRHGERAEDGSNFVESVFGAFRQRMWTILGYSLLDGLAVVDWALAEFGLAPKVVAGGVSMGGDIAVAMAGVDFRIVRVATIGSTPDWARPGMALLNDPDRLLPQGEPDARAEALRAAFDPTLHPERYRQRPAIAFEFGADDRHIPAENAVRFARETGNPDIRVTSHLGLDHLTSARDPQLVQRCVDWLCG